MTASSPSALSPQKPPMPSIFWHAFWMTLLIVAVKASYVAMATFWNWAATPLDYFSWTYVQWAAAASQADAAFSLSAGLAAGALLWISRGEPRLARALRSALVAIGFLLVVYAVVSRQTFSYYGAPLTYQLLVLAGDPARLWSSVVGYITPSALFLVFALPAAYLLLAGASRRIELHLTRHVRLAVRAGSFVIAAAWLALGQGLLNSGWFQAQDRHVKDNPHSVMLQSLALSAGNHYAVLGSTPFAGAEASDFQRADASSRTPVTASRRRPAKRPPNVILIVLESVGARYLGVYGSGLDTTPSLMAERGSYLIFDHYYAPVGWTAYSLLAMTMAKRPPMERYNEFSFRAASMQGASLAEVLAGAGYRTAFMAAGDPDWASAGLLEQKGFGEVLRGKDLPGATSISSWGTEDRALFERMTSWVDEHAGKPFFLTVWTDQTHHPYVVAPGQEIVDVLTPERRKANPSLGNYTALIRAADAQIGKLLAHLRKRGLANDTIVIITGDHGEAFGEPHGGGGHGFTVYDEEVRVPLIIWNPRMFRRAGRSATVGSHIDLAPTILELAGVRAPGDWDGRSLFDLQRPRHAYLFAAAWGQHLMGVRSGAWKYIYDARLGKEELYNLQDDPDELRDLSAAEPERAAELRRRLAAWMDAERQRNEQLTSSAGVGPPAVLGAR